MLRAVALTCVNVCLTVNFFNWQFTVCTNSVLSLSPVSIRVGIGAPVDMADDVT